MAWLGVEPRIATQWEREQAGRLALHVTTSQALAADPAGTALTALSQLPAGPLALHLDVDVLDFIDAPLAENTDCRNTGPSLDQVTEALTAAARDQRMRALSIGELNPTRCAGDPDALPRFVPQHRTHTRSHNSLIIKAATATTDLGTGRSYRPFPTSAPVT